MQKLTSNIAIKIVHFPLYLQALILDSLTMTVTIGCNIKHNSNLHYFSQS